MAEIAIAIAHGMQSLWESPEDEKRKNLVCSMLYATFVLS